MRSSQRTVLHSLLADNVFCRQEHTCYYRRSAASLPLPLRHKQTTQACQRSFASPCLACERFYLFLWLSRPLSRNDVFAQDPLDSFYIRADLAIILKEVVQLTHNV